MAGTSVDHPHPLSQLSEAEFRAARDTIIELHGKDSTLFFRSILAHEPKKADLIPYLEAEHAGTLDESVPRPPRQALIEYDVVTPTEHEYIRSVVNVETGHVVSKDSASPRSKPYFTTYYCLNLISRDTNMAWTLTDNVGASLPCLRMPV